VLAGVAGAGAGGWYLLGNKSTVRPDILLHSAKKEKLQVTIVERGSLESAENNEIVCKVKARSQGSTVASTIRWVIDDGSEVKAGDKLVELDDSGLQDQLQTQQILVGQRRADWIKAEKDYEITLSQNESDIATQEVALELAQAELSMAIEGTIQQTRTDLVGKLTMANSDLAMWEERAGWSARQSRRGYVTAAQADSDAARLKSARITLEGLQKQLEVLDKFQVKRDTVNWQGKIDEANRAIKRANLQAKAKEVQFDEARKAAQATYEKELTRLQDIENEIKKCVITSPDSGFVVYYAEERNRFGVGKQSIIAQGESVNEGQKLMRIPNLSKMLVNTRVHEAMVSRVKGDKLRKTGFRRAVNATQLFTPDLLSGLLAHATLEDTVVSLAFNDRFHNAEWRVSVPGQRAEVRVNAFPDEQMHGHVKSIATVPSQQDFFASDVKVYQTMVAIDSSHEGLKPGMDAEVTIFVDTQDHPVLAVPLQGILGAVNMGETRKCFVLTPEGPQAREITLGLSNETMVEVRGGLEEGEQVVLNPLVLLSEKERREYGNQPARRRQGGGEGKGKGGDWQKGAPGAAPAGGMPGAEGGAPGAGGKGKKGGPRGGGQGPGGPMPGGGPPAQ
jgi:HlyD family secretion protein